jgi:hypothetical protein
VRGGGGNGAVGAVGADLYWLAGASQAAAEAGGEGEKEGGPTKETLLTNALSSKTRLAALDIAFGV